jgi:hypothetical protein
MAEAAHKASDRRLHGLGDNVAKAHVHMAHVKQASKAVITPKLPVGKAGASPKTFAKGANGQASKMAPPAVHKMKAGV